MKKSLWLILIALFVVTPFDTQILNQFIASRTDFLNPIFIFITNIGNGFIILLITTVLFLYKKRNHKQLPYLWISIALALAITAIIKYTILRPRPLVDQLVHKDSPSFPSGHTTAAFSTLAIIYITFPSIKYIWLVFALLVAISRIYTGVHFPTDVIAGALIGHATGVFILQKQNFIKTKILNFKR